MRWIGLLTLATLTLLAGTATAYFRGPDLDHWSVSCQGLIQDPGTRLLRISPRGTFAMEIVPVQGQAVEPQFNLTVTSRDGKRHELLALHGHAFFISDAGRVVCLETPDSHVLPSVLRVIDLHGRALHVQEVDILSNPQLSSDGLSFVFRTRNGTIALDLVTFEEVRYPVLDLFAAGPAGLLAGVAGNNDAVSGVDVTGGGMSAAYMLHVFRGTEHLLEIPLENLHPRRVGFSPGGSAVLVLDQHALLRVPLPSGSVETIYTCPPDAESRDVRVSASAIHLGLRRVQNDLYIGELVTLDPDGCVLERHPGPSQHIPAITQTPPTGRGIPWPLWPDQQHQVGNTYGEYQCYGGSGYLHPGVDVMGTPGQAVYAVREGVVKAVLTISGQWHWRVAIGDAATPDTTKGYLYAHLDEYSIAVDVGDLIEQGQYLGDLVDWPCYDFTHIHFARIEDHGVQWYGDWLCTENPHLDFSNQSENTPPVFEPATGNDLLAFCYNQTSSYQDPQSLQGAVDIIAHVGDLIECDWVCTVQEIRYTIYRVGFPEFPVVDDKLAVFFDMELDTYQGGPIDPFLVELLFKKDGVCNTQGDYNMREFYHIITNSNGDQIYEESDLWEAWDTTSLPDGDYIIRVTAKDVVGNSTTDSMMVTTANENLAWVPSDDCQPVLHQSLPNPGRDQVSIAFRLPASDWVALSIHGPSGRLVKRLVQANLPQGLHRFTWEGEDSRGARSASGIYYYRLATSVGMQTGKLMLLRNP
ncbi:MAG: peptidoglycan DD-metalloendopeptidase family protein [Candidatus Eisenbacteria sp.]|nr:peptidoglycan DD-metalloendopeptidase family protein [Candidatus Eisenbacteria bacterium]